MLACLNGHDGLVAALLRRGADADLTDSLGHSALIIASCHGKPACVQQLLQAECRTDFKARLSTSGVDPKLGTASEFAETRGFPLIAQLIRTHDACMAQAGEPVQSLDQEVVDAATRGDIPVVEAWLACGGAINATHPSPDGAGTYTLLMYAAEGGHAELVAALLDKGATTDVTRKSDGATPLMLAAYAGHRDCVKLLLRPKPPRRDTGVLFDQCAPRPHGCVLLHGVQEHTSCSSHPLLSRAFFPVSCGPLHTSLLIIPSL